MDYNFYTSLERARASELANINRASNTFNDVVSVASLVALVSLVLIVLVVVFDVSGQLSERNTRRSYDEHEVLNAIAKASKVKGIDFQPGATIADIVEATDLPVSRVVSIIRRFKRYEIVKEGQNENGSKIYFV